MHVNPVASNGCCMTHYRARSAAAAAATGFGEAETCGPRRRVRIERAHAAQGHPRIYVGMQHMCSRAGTPSLPGIPRAWLVLELVLGVGVLVMGWMNLPRRIRANPTSRSARVAPQAINVMNQHRGATTSGRWAWARVLWKGRRGEPCGWCDVSWAQPSLIRARSAHVLHLPFSGTMLRCGTLVRAHTTHPSVTLLPRSTKQGGARRFRYSPPTDVARERTLPLRCMRRCMRAHRHTPPRLEAT